MGTRSRIAVQAPHGFDSIYCHWDGSPSHHGPILLKHYNTERKAQTLVGLGDISKLGTKIGKKHDFDEPADPSWCIAYRRDRGEKGCRKKVSTKEWILQEVAEDCGAEYLYVFQAGEWYGAEVGTQNARTPTEESARYQLRPLAGFIKEFEASRE